MDVIVNEAQGLPEKAYLSIRAGDIRKQVQYKRGEAFRFDVKAPPRHLIVDVFEKLGSAQVSLLDLQAAPLEGEVDSAIDILSRRGDPIKILMKVKMEGPDSAAAGDDKQHKRLARHHAAIEAKHYLDDHAVQKLLQSMIHELLAVQPDDAISFMSGYLQDYAAQKASSRPAPPPAAVQETRAPLSPGHAGQDDSSSEGSLPDWSSKPGLGDDEMPGFPVDGSAPLPSLEHHHNILATVLREDPSIYARLKDERTPGGVSLAKCIKTGIDNKGHSIIRTLGLVAGDEHCYDVFRDVFDLVVHRWHGAYPADAVHPTDLDLRKVASGPIDPSGKYAVAVQVCGSRNLSGFSMLPAISRDDRKEVERLISQQLLSLQGSLKGKYYPLRGSSSFEPLPTGMSEEMETELEASHFLFDEPDTHLLLSSGSGRHWPEARGIFASDAGDMAVWVNETDHLKVITRRPDQDLQRAFGHFVDTIEAMRASLETAGRDFASSPHFGFLSSCPSNLGTGLQISVSMCLPFFGARESRFRAVTKELGLSVCLCIDSRVDCQDGSACRHLWDVSAVQHLGCSEVSQVNTLIEGCRKLIELEKTLEAGGSMDLPEVTSLRSRSPVPSRGGDKEDALSEVSDDECPEEIPDLARKCTMAADVFRENPSVYTRLRSMQTPGGVPLGRCIKVSLENNGHPLIKTIGLVAGDEACYETFRDLFDPVIAMRHPGFSIDSGHRTDLDWTKVNGSALDPTGDHVVEVVMRVSRNLRGFRMLPASGSHDLQAVEACLVSALEKAVGELQGEYFPMVGSASWKPKPDGMHLDDEELLEREGLLFEEPDSQLLLSSGYGRGWPDARGVFVDRAREVVAWINEADHLRVAIRQKGSDARGAFKRLCQLHSRLQAALEARGHAFASTEALGFLGPCPSQLGTCLAATVLVRIPLLSMMANFRAVCASMRLHVHPSANSGSSEHVWEVSNLDRLGSTEVEQVNTVLDGCRALVAAEVALAKGEEVVLEPGVPLPLPEQDLEPLVAFADMPGLGDEEYPGFPVDACPASLPDLSRHCSLMAEVLRRDASVYGQLRELKTSLGVTLARCVKTGMDNVGHPMIKTVGAVAGDAECYDLFRPVFDPVISMRHPGHNPSVSQPSDLDHERLSGESLDPAGKHVVSVRLRASRNVEGFRLPPAVGREERRALERLLAGCLEEMRGEYLPLRGSRSWEGRPGGMTSAEEEQLEEEGVLLEAPDANVVLASGSGRHWPEARGVFVAGDEKLVAWVNGEEHLRLIASEEGADVKAAFRRLCLAEAELRSSLSRHSRSFAWSERLGFLQADPGGLGTGMCVEVLARLPEASAMPGFRPLCKRLGLMALSAAEFGEGLWTISNVEVLGSSEVAQVELVTQGVRQLVDIERRLEAGEDVSLDGIPAVADKKAAFPPDAPVCDVSNPKAAVPPDAPNRDVSNPKVAADSKAKPAEVSAPKAADVAPLQDLCKKAALGSEQLGKFTKVSKKPDSKASCARAQQVLEKSANDGRLLSILQSMASSMQASAEALPAFADIPGLGDSEVDGFPADECPEELPDLSMNHSMMADVLKKDPGIYTQLRALRTSSGVCLAKCIKPGIDNRGHPMIRTVGAFAGDAECYDVFGGLFNRIIQARHDGYSPAADKPHPIDLDASKVPSVPVDPTGKHVLSSRVEASRNLEGVSFPASISREDRRKVESRVIQALSQLSGDLQGEYLPLRSSGSCPGRPKGMGLDQEAELETCGLLFEPPDSALLLSSGIGRHWPDARGVFANSERSLAVWVNNEDHVRFLSTQPGDGLQQAFRRLCEALGVVEGYARSEGLGFLTSCPSKLGSGGLQASVLARLPLLGAQGELKATCKRLGVQVRAVQTETWGNVWKISEVAQLGHSEVEMLAHFSSACSRLVEMEVELERGGAATSA